MNTQNKLLVVAVSLASVLSIAGCGKSEEKAPAPGEAPKAAAPEAKTTVGTTIDDSTITTKVKSALLADADVKGLDIKVETNKGEVQLSGFVDSQAQIDRAISIARGVEGVKNVDNKMTLKTTQTTVGEKIDDGIITTKVKGALVAESGVDSGDIAVVTRDGEVQLSGFVKDQSQIERATQVARSVEGVKNVINELSVKK
ncbi:BON domain-containing protein [Nitrosospira sp. Is2]|uniref:BON domain-containing protein n=1 Tax=Nitrosospira sp. Is2 TaxID=3080532 RepID=UPI00295561C3|nr:BON domain-containing protein [Nitrosospira sp. Is2]WON73391.1 BON domain-containing protein [Nitrosospira sp. Is2]